MMVHRVTAAALAFAVMSSPALAVDNVKLRLDWVFGSEFAPVFVAQDKGFFKDEGINVTILPGEGSTVTVKLVGNGDAEFGEAAADQTLLAYAKGLPVVSTAVVLQKTPVAVIFPTASGIKKLTDLYGKTLGITMTSVAEKQWRYVEKYNHLDTSKIKEVSIGTGIAQMIATKRVDAALAFFFNDGLKLVSQGIPMSWILMSDVGLPIYSDALIVNANTIQKDPGLVRRFTHAFVKGWTYSYAHQEEALNIFLKDNPTVDPKYSRLKFPQVMKLTQSADTEKNGIGHSTQEQWEAMQRALLDMGIMDHTVDVSKVFTNAYLH
jgi:NitT/TauT family transport system substrate-binding protein